MERRRFTSAEIWRLRTGVKMVARATTTKAVVGCCPRL